MNLTVKERATLFSILPREGNFKTLKTVRKLRESLALTEDENKKWGVKFEPDGRMTWNTINPETKEPIPQEADIEIGEVANEVIIEMLKKLDESKTLQEDMFSLYEKFVL